MKVYIITSGCYSDYSIVGVSLTKKGAQKAIDSFKVANEYWSRDDTRIEEFTVDELLTFRSVESFGCGMLLDDGSVVEEGTDASINFERPYWSRIEQYDVKIPRYHNRPIVRTRSTVSYAHAHKVAVEARQKWMREKGTK